MGQSSSREASPVEDGVDSRIKLAPDLAQKIARDFQDQEIQNAWRTVQVSILDRRSERDRNVAEVSARLEAATKQMESWKAQNAELDNTIEDLRAKFSDGKIALDYDTRNVADLIQKSKPWKKEMPCLGQRAHWIDCQKKYALDSRPCDAYVDALERCVNETVLKKATTSSS